jgi:hypothetical protein
MGTVTFYIRTTEAADRQAGAGVATSLPMPVATAARQLRYELQQEIQTLGFRIWIASGRQFVIIARDVPETDAVRAATVVERVISHHREWKYLVTRNGRA